MRGSFLQKTPSFQFSPITTDASSMGFGTVTSLLLCLAMSILCAYAEDYIDPNLMDLGMDIHSIIYEHLPPSSKLDYKFTSYGLFASTRASRTPETYFRDLHSRFYILRSRIASQHDPLDLGCIFILLAHDKSARWEDIEYVFRMYLSIKSYLWVRAMLEAPCKIPDANTGLIPNAGWGEAPIDVALGTGLDPNRDKEGNALFFKAMLDYDIISDASDGLKRLYQAKCQPRTRYGRENESNCGSNIVDLFRTTNALSHLVSEMDNPSTLKEMVEQVKYVSLRPVLVKAIANGQIDTTKWLLSLTSPNQRQRRDVKWWVPLDNPCTVPHPKRDSDIPNLLILAINAPKYAVELAKLLLDYGLNPNLKEVDNKSAMDVAVLKGEHELVGLLQQYGGIFDEDILNSRKLTKSSSFKLIQSLGRRLHRLRTF